MVKVSVVVPVYNVQKYLRQCLNSIVDQTLKEIEIICVDDGSTDSSGNILDEYAARDARIRVIHKENTGYGHSMNVGFAAATGEYIGIVESDDYAELNMFETLYEVAHKNDLDVVKSAFYFYYSSPEEKNEKYEIVSRAMARKTICPRTDFLCNMEMVEFYNMKPAIWSSIYRRDFIRENNICFLETPGASFQDTGFNFKVMAMAQKVQLLEEAFLHYRQDGEGSSVSSKGKVFCVCDEYREMQRFLDEHPVIRGRLEYVLQRIKCDTYMWNYERLGKKYKYIFLERASEEYKEALKKGVMNRDYFEDHKWETMMEIADDPVGFHTQTSVGAYKAELHWKKEYERIRHSWTYRVGKCITITPRMLRRFVRCIYRHGLKYTFTISFRELREGKTFE